MVCVCVCVDVCLWFLMLILSLPGFDYCAALNNQTNANAVGGLLLALAFSVSIE